MIAAVALLAGLVAATGCPAPDMVFVPAGSFWMGSDDTERRLADRLSSEAVREARWFDAELSRYQETLTAFCIDRVLVTQAQYRAFTRATGHAAPEITRKAYRRQGFLVHDYDREVIPYLWGDGKPPAGQDDHPVVL